MVSVVVGLELGERLVICNAQALREALHALSHLPQQLLLGDAANACKLGQHGDVRKVVELAEDGELAELGDTGEKNGSTQKPVDRG